MFTSVILPKKKKGQKEKAMEIHRAQITINFNSFQPLKYVISARLAQIAFQLQLLQELVIKGNVLDL